MSWCSWFYPFCFFSNDVMDVDFGNLILFVVVKLMVINEFWDSLLLDQFQHFSWLKLSAFSLILNLGVWYCLFFDAVDDGAWMFVVLILVGLLQNCCLKYMH